MGDRWEIAPAARVASHGAPTSAAACGPTAVRRVTWPRTWRHWKAGEAHDAEEHAIEKAVMVDVVVAEEKVAA